MFVSKRKIRVLVAKTAPNSEEVEPKGLGGFLTEAGMDVIYTGINQTPELIAAAAQREDVDVIGLSCAKATQRRLCQRIVALLRAKSMDDCLVVVCDANSTPEAAEINAQDTPMQLLLGGSPRAVVEYLQMNVRAPWLIQ